MSAHTIILDVVQPHLLVAQVDLIAQLLASDYSIGTSVFHEAGVTILTCFFSWVHVRTCVYLFSVLYTCVSEYICVPCCCCNASPSPLQVDKLQQSDAERIEEQQEQQPPPMMMGRCLYFHTLGLKLKLCCILVCIDVKCSYMSIAFILCHYRTTVDDYCWSRARSTPRHDANGRSPWGNATNGYDASRRHATWRRDAIPRTATNWRGHVLLGNCLFSSV